MRLRSTIFGCTLYLATIAACTGDDPKTGTGGDGGTVTTSTGGTGGIGIVGSGGSGATGGSRGAGAAGGGSGVTGGSGGAGTTGAGTTGAGTGTGGGGGSGTGCVVGRAVTDQPDDVQGYQVHVNYVLPSNGIDEGLDTNGAIATSVAAFSKWLSGQMGGRQIRLDTCGGQLDIRFFKINQTEMELKAKGIFLRDAIEEAMSTAGLIAPNKIEAVYYGGDSSESCGSGPWPPGLVGHVAGLYLKGTFANPSIPSCASNPLAPNKDTPGYLDFSILHEILHTVGIVPTCAPHHVPSGHVSDSPTDIMYAGNLPWNPSVLDVNKDDYFGANIPGCTDLANSAFLDPLPANAMKPPGW